MLQRTKSLQAHLSSVNTSNVDSQKIQVKWLGLHGACKLWHEPRGLAAFCWLQSGQVFEHVGHVLNPPFWATVSRQTAPGRAKDNARLWGRVERLTDYTWNRATALFLLFSSLWAHSFITYSDFNYNSILLFLICVVTELFVLSFFFFFAYWMRVWFSAVAVHMLLASI